MTTTSLKDSTTPLPEVPESSSSEPSSSPSSSTTTMPTTTTAPTTVALSFEETIIDGSMHRMSFKIPFVGNEGKMFDMAMMYTDGKVNPGDAIRSYSFLVMTENNYTTKFYRYPGNDTSLEHLYMFHDQKNGFKWDRNGTDSEIIKGKSEQEANEVFRSFDVRFTDKEIVIYAAPNYDQVLYVSDEKWMNCDQPDCYPIRIGNPEELDKSLYTFLVDAE
jgi:hypothetical protein